MSTYVCLNPYSNGIYNLTTVAGVQLKQGALRLNPYSNGIYNLTLKEPLLLMQGKSES